MDKKPLSIIIRNTSCLFRKNIEASKVLKENSELTGGKGSIIFFIDEMNKRGNKVYQKMIESNFKVNRSTASIIIKELEDNSYVIKTEDKEDKRLKELTLTEKAYQFLNSFSTMLIELNEKATSDFKDEEKNLLENLLNRMIENLERGNEHDKNA